MQQIGRVMSAKHCKLVNFGPIGLGRSNVTGGPEDWMSTLSEQQAQQRGGSAALHPSPEKEGPGVAYGCRSAVSALQAARNVPKRQKMDSGPVSDLAPLPGLQTQLLCLD